jgi:hypothetical protein
MGGGAGIAGSGAGQGGAAGSASGGTGGVGSDRCDVAVHDPDNPPAMLTLSGSLGTHDPVMFEEGGRSQRVPITNPSNGVRPMEVSTEWPPRTAVIELPLPRWQVMQLKSRSSRSRMAAARPAT